MPVGCASPFKGALQLEAHVLYLFQQLYVKIRKMSCSGSSERAPPPLHEHVAVSFLVQQNSPEWFPES